MDPLTESYPYFTPYQFAGNDVISFVDLDGLEKGEPPIYQKVIDLARSFEVQTTTDIIVSATKNQMWKKSKKVPIFSIGDAYEDAVLRSYQFPTTGKRAFKVPKDSQSSNIRVIPDAIRNTYGVVYEMNNKFGTKMKKHVLSAKDATMIEVKFSSVLDLERHSKNQIIGMIDVLSEAKGIYANNKFYPNAKASDYGLAKLEFVTPANALIGANLKETADIVAYATSKNVQITQRFTQIEEGNRERIRVANGLPLNIITPKKSQGSILGLGGTLDYPIPKTIYDKRPSVEFNWEKFKKL